MILSESCLSTFERMKGWVPLSNIGEPRLADSEFIPATDAAINLLFTDKWNDIREEAFDEISLAAAEMSRTGEFRDWNDVVKEITDALTPIRDSIRSSLSRLGIPESNLVDAIYTEIDSDILSSLIATEYSDLGTWSFYNNLLNTYLNGRLPCGWTGAYPEGILLLH